jgi:tetratricopeptide (TPR) repeat protein
MLRLRASAIFHLSVLIFILWRYLPGPAWGQTRLLSEDTYTPLNLSYQYMKSGKTDAARVQLEQVIQADPCNAYALNNLAVISEQQGRLKEAMAYLLEAEAHATEYTEKPEELCQVGGMCMALKPSHTQGSRSSIAALVHGNINLLKIKIAQQDAQEKQ